jgi:hypothetical protein
MSAIFTANNQMTARITSVVGMYIWRGHPLRVRFQQMILPIKRCSKNLQSPGIKSKVLFMTYSFPKIFFLKFAVPSNLKPQNPQSRNPNIDWSKLWKNINNKIPSTQARSIWLRLVNNKFPLKVILFNLNRIASPVCTECNQYAETVIHKYTNCISTRVLCR